MLFVCNHHSNVLVGLSASTTATSPTVGISVRWRRLPIWQHVGAFACWVLGVVGGVELAIFLWKMCVCAFVHVCAHVCVLILVISCSVPPLSLPLFLSRGSEFVALCHTHRHDQLDHSHQWRSVGHGRCHQQQCRWFASWSLFFFTNCSNSISLVTSPPSLFVSLSPSLSITHTHTHTSMHAFGCQRKIVSGVALLIGTQVMIPRPRMRTPRGDNSNRCWVGALVLVRGGGCHRHRRRRSIHPCRPAAPCRDSVKVAMHLQLRNNSNSNKAVGLHSIFMCVGAGGSGGWLVGLVRDEEFDGDAIVECVVYFFYSMLFKSCFALSLPLSLSHTHTHCASK
jgi:hypothetical protein